MNHSLEDRRVVRTKTDFKTAVLALLQQKAYESIKVKDIVAQANYNRATFYRHYKSKEELVDDLTDDIIDELTESFRAPYQSKSTVVLEELRLDNVLIFHHIETHKAFYQLWKDQGVPGFEQKFIQTIVYLHKRDFTYMLGEERLDLDVWFTYRAYGLWGLIVKWIQSDFTVPKDQMTLELIQLLKYQPEIHYHIQVANRGNQEGADHASRNATRSVQ